MHALAADFNFWKNQWGDNIWMAYGNSNSAGVAIFVRLRQKERTQMQNGRSKDRFYFTVLQLLWQSDKPIGYETLWSDRQDKQDIEHRRTKDISEGGKPTLY